MGEYRVSTERGVHLSYFYDLALPSRYAAPIQIINTCRALCERGVSVTIYTNRLTAPSADACLAFYGLQPHEHLRLVPLFAAPPGRFALQGALGRIVRDASATTRHFVISRGEPGLALFARLRRLARPPGARFVYEAHKLCSWQAAEPLLKPGRGPLARRRLAWTVARVRRLERAAVEGADGLICLTAGVRTALEREFQIARPALILPSGVAPIAGPLPDDSARDIDILYAGKLERRKGVHDLIEAMRALPGQRLWIVGGTPREIAALRQWAGQLGVADRIVFTGFVEPAAVRALYLRARVGACPLPVGESVISEQFTSPLKVLEMMACGVPIVGTDLPSLRELLRHDRTALLVEPGDPPALARALQTLLGDRPRAARLAHAARAEVARYSWDNRARRLLEFLTALD